MFHNDCILIPKEEIWLKTATFFLLKAAFYRFIL